jgi:hypothetical protein
MTNTMLNTGIKYFGSKIMLSSSGDSITDLALKEGFCAQFWLAGAPANSWAIDHLLSVAEKRLAEARGGLIS